MLGKGTLEAISTSHQQAGEPLEERNVLFIGNKPQIMSVLGYNHEASMSASRVCEVCCHTRLHI